MAKRFRNEPNLCKESAHLVVGELKSPGMDEGSNLSVKKKEPRKRVGRQTEAICFLDGEIICILSVIVVHDNRRRRRCVWIRFDGTHSTLQEGSPSYDTAREQQESGNTAKERSDCCFRFALSPYSGAAYIREPCTVKCH